MHVCSCWWSPKCAPSLCYVLDQVFFPHCPFPTSDIMRCLSNRDALLEGFVTNDIVGVHAFGPARAFMEVGWSLLFHTATLL